MILRIACLALTAGQATPPPDGGTAATLQPDRREIAAARLRVVDLEEASLREALSLRAPGLELHDQADPAALPEPHLFIDVHPGVAGVWELDIIVSDGRAYFRDVESTREEAARTLASIIAQLVAGIEDGTVQPDRGDVGIPRPPEHSPEPAAGATRPDPLPPRPPEPADAPSVPPGRDGPSLGVFGTVGAAIGLGLPELPDRFGGWGGSAGLSFRGSRGVFVIAQLRGLGRGGHDGYRLGRLRAGAGAGYALRRQNFELQGALLGTVETWSVHRNGERIDPSELGQHDGDARPLVGGALRVSPGYLIRPSGTPRFALRVGATVEIAGSWLPQHGAPIVSIRVDHEGNERQAFRAGGFELAGGLELAAWFTLRRPRDRRHHPP